MKRKQRTVFCLLRVFGLLAFGFVPTLVKGLEDPSVMVQANGPGWITVSWEHTGRDTAHYLVQRQEPAFTWVFVINTHSHTDMGLKASTTTTIACAQWITTTTKRVRRGLALRRWRRKVPTLTRCPVYTGHEIAPDRIRISWSSTTRYGSFNVRWSEKGTRAGQHNVRGNGTSGSFEAHGLVPGRTFVFLVQGCNWGLLGSGCSGWAVVELSTPLPLPPRPSAPAVTASASGPSQIVLSWRVIEAERIGRVVIERDGRKHVEREGAPSRYDDSVRPNTEYAYRVCLANETGTACSGAVTAMASPRRPAHWLT